MPITQSLPDFSRIPYAYPIHSSCRNCNLKRKQVRRATHIRIFNYHIPTPIVFRSANANGWWIVRSHLNRGILSIVWDNGEAIGIPQITILRISRQYQIRPSVARPVEEQNTILAKRYARRSNPLYHKRLWKGEAYSIRRNVQGIDDIRRILKLKPR